MSDWLPSLNALRAFETVARHMNYRRAAEELKVSPAAVKQLVRKLEDALGRSLLEKRGRGLILTATGETASRELAKAFRLISDTVGEDSQYGSRLEADHNGRSLFRGRMAGPEIAGVPAREIRRSTCLSTLRWRLSISGEAPRTSPFDSAPGPTRTW